MIRYHITLGATTTAGGKVVSAISNRSLNGVKVACAGDTVACPACKSEGVIEPDGIALILLDQMTGTLHPHRPYTLELESGVIEGMTDQHGATRLLTASERASFIRWHAAPAAPAT